MQWKALAVALLVEHGSGQMLEMMRFSCSQLVVDRIDPLVNPGSIPSPHLHQIVGGDSFNASMDPTTHDLPTLSTCTSCTFSEDFSNYWTAVLYFRARNGTFKRVPQFASEGLHADGGITVYYIPSPDRQESVTAFRPGFRMLVGDASLRSPGTARKALPNGFCAGGIRSVITFPTCWDGKNTDSPDHRSHVAYPSSGSSDTSVGASGVCPASHPVKIPQVMLEVMWDTRPFNNKDLWPEDGSQPFVWSTGDKDGYSQHGDYVFGWEGDSLQRAMDARCNDTICSTLKTQSSEEAMKCTKPPVVKEDIDGWLTEIPGMAGAT
ncbi:hypothetical protein DL769_009559 [Monosporascus sp. CRB-8-3]|nr:hypothetical protein DL769_009559 [Monosporascus sp. CRB-8-3]